MDSILDLCTPPEGYQFTRGVWVAHDVDWSLVTDTIAPILAGVVGENPRRRYRAARAILGADLLVLASAGREIPGPIHTWARLGTVHGRVQHAKMAIFQFRSEAGSAIVTRAFVASANLTVGGILHNREVLVSDEISGRTRRASIVSDILAALRHLAGEDAMSPPVAGDLRSSLKRLAEAIPKSVSHTRQLRHSLSSPSPLIDAIKPVRGRAVVRFVIVSPGHAFEGKRLAEHLVASGLITPKTSVEIFSGSGANSGGAGAAVSFSPTFVQHLREHGAGVSLYAVPETETIRRRDRRRALHAKMVATVDDVGEVCALVGSANCSTRGWLGVNREAMVLQGCDEAALEEFLDELRASPAESQPVDPPANRISESGGNPPPGVPVFEPRRGPEGQLTGPINLDDFKRDGFSILAASLGGVAVEVPKLEAGDLLISERNAVLVLTVQTPSGVMNEYRFQLAGGAPDANPLLWRTDPDEPPERTDAWLTALLDDLKKAATISPSPPDPGGGGKCIDDAYRVPLQRRLVLFARHREALRRKVPQQVLRDAIAKFLADDMERTVAKALVLDTQAPDSALLEALKAVASGKG